jgi:hypothetical protein
MSRVTVHPTLEAMASVYLADASTGPQSERFRRYVEGAKNGALVSGYNPMTTKPVLPVIEALRSLDAEKLIADIADRLVEELEIDDDIELFITIATPGMWTDRAATTVEHIIAPKHPGEILLWHDDPPTIDTLRVATLQQTIRCLFHRWTIAPTLRNIAVREGCAHGLCGGEGKPSVQAAALLDTFGHRDDFGTITAFLFGDNVAESLGFSPLGLAVNEGIQHAAARCSSERSDKVLRALAAETTRPPESLG